MQRKKEIVLQRKERGGNGKEMGRLNMKQKRECDKEMGRKFEGRKSGKNIGFKEGNRE